MEKDISEQIKVQQEHIATLSQSAHNIKANFNTGWSCMFLKLVLIKKIIILAMWPCPNYEHMQGAHRDPLLCVNRGTFGICPAQLLCKQ